MPAPVLSTLLESDCTTNTSPSAPSRPLRLLKLKVKAVLKLAFGPSAIRVVLKTEPARLVAAGVTRSTERSWTSVAAAASPLICSPAALAKLPYPNDWAARSAAANAILICVPPGPPVPA